MDKSIYNIYNLKLHDEIEVCCDDDGIPNCWCFRVPGGWIYTINSISHDKRNFSSVFVPFNNEFQEDENNYNEYEEALKAWKEFCLHETGGKMTFPEWLKGKIK